ncbi:MAG: PTS sugar transporter subunit IIA [Akkermansia sp.]|nr:PTS sugar transporter subunit IIA [Akkermansia sp.]
MFDAEELSNETLVWVRGEELPCGMSHVEMVRLLAGELAGLTGWRKRTLVNTALDREAQESTYLGYGLAIPHARVFEIPQPAVYLARSTAGVDWQGSPVRLVFLVVVPEECPEWHLQLLSRIVRWRQKSGLTEDEMVGMPAGLLADQLRGLLVLS